MIPPTNCNRRLDPIANSAALTYLLASYLINDSSNWLVANQIPFPPPVPKIATELRLHHSRDLWTLELGDLNNVCQSQRKARRVLLKASEPSRRVWLISRIQTNNSNAYPFPFPFPIRMFDARKLNTTAFVVGQLEQVSPMQFHINHAAISSGC